jgi:hypothetical protein
LQDVAKPFPQGRSLYADERFDAPVQVPVHHISAADVDFFLSVVAEVIDAGMLQKPADDAANPNILAEMPHLGAERADPAHEEVYLDAFL